jgi:hypothetical protein
VIILALTVICGVHAQPVATASERQVLLGTLTELQSVMHEPPGPLPPNFREAVGAVRWLRSLASRWQPREEGESKGLNDSLQLILTALKFIYWGEHPKIVPLRREVLFDDLIIKSQHCRQMGLTTPAGVEVKTKQQGLQEVSGLEVWYLEKFLASDPKAQPHRLNGFSSPIRQGMVPGRYVMWAKDPTKGTNGKKDEFRVGTALITPTPNNLTSIEVLAP